MSGSVGGCGSSGGSRPGLSGTPPHLDWLVLANDGLVVVNRSASRGSARRSGQASSPPMQLGYRDHQAASKWGQLIGSDLSSFWRLDVGQLVRHALGLMAPGSLAARKPATWASTWPRTLRSRWSTPISSRPTQAIQHGRSCAPSSMHSSTRSPMTRTSGSSISPTDSSGINGSGSRGRHPPGFPRSPFGAPPPILDRRADLIRRW